MIRDIPLTNMMTMNGNVRIKKGFASGRDGAFYMIRFWTEISFKKTYNQNPLCILPRSLYFRFEITEKDFSGGL